MIKSMTGFGKGEVRLAGKVITIEVKSLNSKQSDIFMKMPSSYKSKEIDLRNIISQSLNRGKIDFLLSVESTENNLVKINKELALSYFNQIKELEPSVGDKMSEEMLSLILRMPEVIGSTGKEELDENEWEAIKKATNEALKNLDNFRNTEGKVLENDLFSHIKNIETYLTQLDPLDKIRIAKIREKQEKAIAELKEVTVDKNRFEQELIYYFEKVDISEEKVRLKSHLDYFVVTAKEENPGKKLGFIAQEIGREINTIGSKSNDADMQQMVVQMKDELEKIKEQSLNVL
ncbi:MAG: YicC/YloC family endoribonuclease [Flavobacteriales bacterium]